MVNYYRYIFILTHGWVNKVLPTKSDINLIPILLHKVYTIYKYLRNY